VITITIDGQEMRVAKGRTILEVAREHGIHIPTLCYHVRAVAVNWWLPVPTRAAMA